MVKQEYSKRLKKFVWGFDMRIGQPGAKRRSRRFCFETKDEAEEAAAALRLYTRADEFGLPRPVVPVTLAQLVAAKEKEKATTEYQRSLLYVLKALSSTLPNATLQTFTTAQLKEFVQYLRALNLKDSTIKNYLQLVSSAFHSAPEFFPELENWKIPKIPYPRGANKRRERIFNGTEIAAILDVLRNPPDLRHKRGRPFDPHMFNLLADLFELALLTVRRQGELLSVRRSDLNLERNLLRIVATKGDETFFMPLGGRAREILVSRAALTKRQGDYLFAYADGSRAGIVKRVVRLFEWACDRVGIPYGNRVSGGAVYHDTRHTAMTAILQAGHDLATAQSLSRHSSTTIALRYAHATAASQRAAISSLELLAVQKVSIEAGREGYVSDPCDEDAPLQLVSSQ